MELHDYGWTAELEQRFEPFEAEAFSPARILREARGTYLLGAEDGESAAEVSGRFRHEARGRIDFPAVGDWVVFRPRPTEGRGTIHAVLPRRSRFVRKVAGPTTEAQVVASNVDTVFVVTGLDGNFSLRRIERYLTLAGESGVEPVILLNKADVCDDPDLRMRQVEGIVRGVPIHAVSARLGTGLQSIVAHLGHGKTGALLGSSGVGKSSLVNRLLGEDRLATREVREDDHRGRHTTTHRELIRLPDDGGLVIDTPGMRELQLWGGPECLAGGFADVEEMAIGCRFRDCRHEGEPGCAVQLSLGEGWLDVDRFESYLTQSREIAYLERRRDARARKAEAARWRRITIESRKRRKSRDRGR